MKKVWDHLDEWDCEDPSPQCPADFSSKFREQFPSAFSQSDARTNRRLLESGYGKVAFAGGVLCVALACVIAFQMDREIAPPVGDQVAEHPVSESSVIAAPVREAAPLVASAPPVNQRPSVPNTSQNPIAEREPDLIPQTERQMVDNRMFRTVSFGGGRNTVQTSALEPRLMERHTMQINNHPVTGFAALSFSTEEQAY